MTQSAPLIRGPDKKKRNPDTCKRDLFQFPVVDNTVGDSSDIKNFFGFFEGSLISKVDCTVRPSPTFRV